MKRRQVISDVLLGQYGHVRRRGAGCAASARNQPVNSAMNATASPINEMTSEPKKSSRLRMSPTSRYASARAPPAAFIAAPLIVTIAWTAKRLFKSVGTGVAAISAPASKSWSAKSSSRVSRASSGPRLIRSRIVGRSERASRFSAMAFAYSSLGGRGIAGASYPIRTTSTIRPAPVACSR